MGGGEEREKGEDRVDGRVERGGIYTEMRYEGRVSGGRGGRR